MRILALLTILTCVLAQNRGGRSGGGRSSRSRTSRKIDYASMGENWDDFCDNHGDDYPAQCGVSTPLVTLNQAKNRIKTSGPSNALLDIQWAAPIALRTTKNAHSTTGKKLRR